MNIKPIALGGIILCAAFGVRSAQNYKGNRYPSEPADIYLGATNNISLAGIRQTSKNPAAYEFAQNLVQNEDLLKKTLNISAGRFPLYRDLAISIAKEETDFGTDISYMLKKFCPAVFDFSRRGPLSKGLTNFKIDGAKGERENLRRLGVNTDNIWQPSKSAFATIEHLNHLATNYYERVYLSQKGLAQAHQREFGTILDLPEHILVCWKGLRVDITDESVRELARKNMEMIIADRTAADPKTYVGRILKAAGYVWDTNGKKFMKML